MDDAIARVNGGTWPDIETKNTVVLPKVLDELRAMPDVVLLGSLPVDGTRQLREIGFTTMLLRVSQAELRRRHSVRLAEEGWTNVQWFEYEQSVIRGLRDNDLFDGVIDGEQSVASVAAEIVTLVDHHRS